MFSNFFNRMYYGKAGKGDYKPEDLPATRRQLFFEMLRIRFTSLMRANLFYVLFWLPAMIWTVINLLALMNTMSPDMGLQDATMAEQINGIIIMYLAGMIPCIAITGPFTAGITYILRNWARDQHSFFMSDFWDTVKANWKQALAVSALTSVMPIALYVSWQFYGQMAATSVVYIVPQMLVLGVGVCWSLALTIIYNMMITYDLKFGQLIRNSLVLTVGRLPLTFVIRLATLIVPAVAVLLVWTVPIEQYVLLVLAAYYLLLGFALSRFITASYANSLFDRFINPRIEGAQTGMGLRQYTEADYEVDPTVPGQSPDIHKSDRSDDE